MGEKYNIPECFYRVSVKGMCVQDDKVLLIKQADTLGNGSWELPGGGLGYGEDVTTGLAREVKEEMGLGVTHMSNAPKYVWSYEIVSDHEDVEYYSLILVYNIEFENLDFTPSEECEEIGFFSIEEMADLNLHNQIRKLPEYFNPEDFNEVPKSA